MYLCDKDLRNKLDELNIVTDNPKTFDPDEQIQPASIDLCLSNVFWEPRKDKTIDLRKSMLLELSPRRYWKRKVLRDNEFITLKPGTLLLGRISEEFTIPHDCAGKIEGRSSFARLGLGIHCTGDFINPGYRGHMPLQLFNYSPNPIRIFPFIPICQLKLVRMSATPSRLYGEEKLQSKYMNDDGGPSYWWRDKRFAALQKALKEKNLDLHVQEDLFRKMGIQEPEIIERFEKHLSKLKEPHRENSSALIESFTRKEDKLRVRDSLINGLAIIICPGLVFTGIGLFATDFIEWYHYLVWTVAVISAYPCYKALRSAPKQYFGAQELRNCENQTTT